MKIILDLDGTILDCSTRMYRLFRRLAPGVDVDQDSYWAEKRKPRSNEDLLRSAGASEQEIAEFTSGWMSLIEADEFLRLRVRVYRLALPCASARSGDRLRSF